MLDKSLLEKLRKQLSAPEKAEKKIERKRLVVYHDDEELKVMLPPYWGIYSSIRKQIESDKYSMASFADMVDILHAYFENPNEIFSQQMIKPFINGYAMCSEAFLYLPERGIYVDKKPKILEGQGQFGFTLLEMKEGELYMKWHKGDENVSYFRKETPDFIEALLKDEERIERFREVCSHFVNSQVRAFFSTKYESLYILGIDVKSKRLEVFLESPYDFHKRRTIKEDSTFSFAVDRNVKTDAEVKK